MLTPDEEKLRNVKIIDLKHNAGDQYLHFLVSCSWKEQREEEK